MVSVSLFTRNIFCFLISLIGEQKLFFVTGVRMLLWDKYRIIYLFT